MKLSNSHKNILNSISAGGNMDVWLNCKAEIKELLSCGLIQRTSRGDRKYKLTKKGMAAAMCPDTPSLVHHKDAFETIIPRLIRAGRRFFLSDGKQIEEVIMTGFGYVQTKGVLDGKTRYSEPSVLFPVNCLFKGPRTTGICELSENVAGESVACFDENSGGPGDYESAIGNQQSAMSSTADPLEVIQRIALFMADDWKACCVLQLYIAAPNAPISRIAEHIRLSPAAICDARQRAAARFPELASVLGLNTKQAAAQQQRFEAAKTNHPQQNLF